MWPEGQSWKPGPAYPATVAAWPPCWWFCVWFFLISVFRFQLSTFLQSAFRLIQLAEIPFEAIAGTPVGIMILRTLKAERSGDLLADPVWDESLLDLIPRLIFEMLLRYILRADIVKDHFANKLKLF